MHKLAQRNQADAGIINAEFLSAPSRTSHCRTHLLM